MRSDLKRRLAAIDGAGVGRGYIVTAPVGAADAVVEAALVVAGVRTGPADLVVVLQRFEDASPAALIGRFGLAA